MERLFNLFIRCAYYQSDSDAKLLTVRDLFQV